MGAEQAYFPPMTTTLTLDADGRITLPEAIKRAFGIQPGTPLRAEVTLGRLELVTDSRDDLPEVTELNADGFLRLPPGVRITAGQIVDAIKSGREQRSTKLAGR
jgi:bifunctional DNA-binding transcriptional regulator/antitoxin component of YhaV-PrlF toxin-antitoxin module